MEKTVNCREYRALFGIVDTCIGIVTPLPGPGTTTGHLPGFALISLKK